MKWTKMFLSKRLKIISSNQNWKMALNLAYHICFPENNWGMSQYPEFTFIWREVAGRMSKWETMNLGATFCTTADPGWGPAILQGHRCVGRMNQSPWVRKFLALAGKTGPHKGHLQELRREEAIHDPSKDCGQFQRGSSPYHSQVSGYRKANRKWHPASKLLSTGVITSFREAKKVKKNYYRSGQLRFT